MGTCTGSRAAFAEEGPSPPATAAADAEPTLPVTAAPPAPTAPIDQELKSVSLGAIVDASFGGSAAGLALMGELGGQYIGIESFSTQRWLLQWDALAALRGGVLANSEPYTPLIGGHLGGTAELGRRFGSPERWSPYAGLRLAGDLAILTDPATSFDALNSINSVDGVGGVNGFCAARLNVGASFLEVPRSLLLLAFLQGAFTSAGINTEGAAFAEVGLSVRYDVANDLTAILEGLVGRTPVTTDEPALQTTRQTTVGAVSFSFRRIFANRMWFNVALNYSREFDQRTYHTATYQTANTATGGLELLYGLPLD